MGTKFFSRRHPRLAAGRARLVASAVILAGSSLMSDALLAQGAGEEAPPPAALPSPFAAVGVTDRFTIAGGTPLFFGGGDGRLQYFAPKFQIVRRERVRVGAGVLALHDTGDRTWGHYLGAPRRVWCREGYGSSGSVSRRTSPSSLLWNEAPGSSFRS